jgi:hypothetical protein
MRLLARWLGNPIVYVLTAAAVAADVGYWRIAAVGHASLLGGESVLPTRAVRAAAAGWPCTALVEGPDGSLSLRARATPSASIAAPLLVDEAELPPGWRVVAHLRCPVVTTTVGVSAPSLEVTPYRLAVEPADVRGLSARQEVAGRYLFSRYLEQWLEQRGDRERARVVPQRLARGDGVVWRVRARWLAHDCAVAACAGAAAASVALCPVWLTGRVRRVVRDRCAGCGYDLRGLSRGVCPECGRIARDRGG